MHATVQSTHLQIVSVERLEWRLQIECPSTYSEDRLAKASSPLLVSYGVYAAVFADRNVDLVESHAVALDLFQTTAFSLVATPQSAGRCMREHVIGPFLVHVSGKLGSFDFLSNYHAAKSNCLLCKSIEEQR